MSKHFFRFLIHFVTDSFFLLGILFAITILQFFRQDLRGLRIGEFYLYPKTSKRTEIYAEGYGLTFSSESNPIVGYIFEEKDLQLQLAHGELLRLHLRPDQSLDLENLSENTPFSLNLKTKEGIQWFTQEARLITLREGSEDFKITLGQNSQASNDQLSLSGSGILANFQKASLRGEPLLKESTFPSRASSASKGIWDQLKPLSSQEIDNSRQNFINNSYRAWLRQRYNSGLWLVGSQWQFSEEIAQALSSEALFRQDYANMKALVEQAIELEEQRPIPNSLTFLLFYGPIQEGFTQLRQRSQQKLNAWTSYQLTQWLSEPKSVETLFLFGSPPLWNHFLDLLKSQNIPWELWSSSELSAVLDNFLFLHQLGMTSTIPQGWSDHVFNWILQRLKRIEQKLYLLDTKTAEKEIEGALRLSSLISQLPHSNEKLQIISDHLFVTALSYANNQGFLPRNIDKQGQTRGQVFPENVYPFIASHTYEAKIRALHPQNPQAGHWVAFIPNMGSLRINPNSFESTFNLPEGLSHRFIFHSVERPLEVLMEDRSWVSDPRFEAVFGVGWIYDFAQRTLFVLARQPVPGTSYLNVRFP